MASITPRYLELWKRKFASVEEVQAAEAVEIPITGNEANPSYTINLDPHPKLAQYLPERVSVILVDKNDTEAGEFEESKRFTDIFVDGVEDKCFRLQGLIAQEDAWTWTRHKYDFEKLIRAMEAAEALIKKAEDLGSEVPAVDSESPKETGGNDEGVNEPTDQQGG